MALAISNIPVLTGEAAERFVRMAEETERNRGCIDFSKEREEWRGFEQRNAIGKDDPKEIICAFTVSNASIFTNCLPNARKKKIGKDVPSVKRDLIYPAVLIGRLGVNQKYLHQNIGSQLMSRIKDWFIGRDNKTGCRYLVVDAYNKPTACDYCQRNGFTFMFSTEEQERQYRNITADGPRTRA